MLTGFSAESRKNLWFGNFSNLNLDKRLPTKNTKLDVDAFSEEGKRFKSQIQSLAEIVEDQPVAIWHVCTYSHKQNLSSKIRVD